MSETCECTFNLYRLHVIYPKEGTPIHAKDVGSKIRAYYKSQQAAGRVFGLKDANPQEGRLLDNLSELDGIVRGQIWNWEPGASVPELHIPKEGEKVETEAITATKRDGDAIAEVGKGMCFFAIHGEYIAFCVKAAQASLLSTVLAEILNQKRKAEQAVSIEFLSIPAPEWTDEILNKAKEMKLRPILNTQEDDSGKFKFDAKTKSLLSIFGDVSQHFSQDVSEDIELTISLRIRNKRKCSADSRRLVTSLLRQLSNTPNLCVVLNDTKVLTADTMRIKGAITVNAKGKIPDSEDVLTKLTTWLVDNIPGDADV